MSGQLVTYTASVLFSTMSDADAAYWRDVATGKSRDLTWDTKLPAAVKAETIDKVLALSSIQDVSTSASLSENEAGLVVTTTARTR